MSSAEIPNLHVRAPADPDLGEFPVVSLWEHFNQNILVILFHFEWNRQISLWHTDINPKPLYQIFPARSGMEVDIVSDSGV